MAKEAEAFGRRGVQHLTHFTVLSDRRKGKRRQKGRKKIERKREKRVTYDRIVKNTSSSIYINGHRLIKDHQSKLSLACLRNQSKKVLFGMR